MSELNVGHGRFDSYKSSIIGLFKNSKQKDATERSLPKEKIIHGITVRKLPNGSYLKAFNKVQNMPETIIKGCFPGQDVNDVVNYLINIDSDGIIAIAGKLLTTIPEQFLSFISELTNIPYETLLNVLSPTETLDILEELWKLNDLRSFFKRLGKKVRESNLIQSLTNVQNQKES